MSIEALSMAMSQSELASNVSLAVFKMAKDTVEQRGQQMTKMIDSAALERTVNPNVGSHVDIKL